MIFCEIVYEGTLCQNDEEIIVNINWNFYHEFTSHFSDVLVEIDRLNGHHGVQYLFDCKSFHGVIVI
jgi:N-formylglutamate amidohydrolase